MRAEKLIGALAAAWKLLVDIPLPDRLRNRGFNADEDGELVSLAFPVVGVITGAAFAVLAFALVVVFGRVAGAAIFGAAALVLCEMKNSGRGFAALIGYFSARMNGESPEDALSTANPGWRTLSGLWAAVAAVVVILVKASAFALIAANRASWLIPVFVLGFTVQGFLAAEGAEPVLRVEVGSRRHLWFPAAFVMLFYIGSPAAPLFSVLIAAVGAWRASELMKNFKHGEPAVAAAVFGSFAELATAVVGALATL